MVAEVSARGDACRKKSAAQVTHVRATWSPARTAATRGQLLRVYKAPLGSASVHRGPTMVDLVEAARVRGPRAPTPSVHRFHHFLVLDFEATCDKAAPPRPQEIIEFPILRVNGKSMEVESTFHTYVRPTAHPQLSAFCTELTGIVQDMVDGRPTLDQVLQMVDEWMEKEGLLDPETKSVFVTCGDWDLKVIRLQEYRRHPEGAGAPRSDTGGDGSTLTRTFSVADAQRSAHLGPQCSWPTAAARTHTQAHAGTRTHTHAPGKKRKCDMHRRLK
ncbi:ERI1 exoribonuclease 3 isoform X2 [Lampetra planeri]